MTMSDAKQERTPANQNPWYVLMTLYGEQTGEEIDNALHDKNREAWNSWAGFVLPESIRDGCSAGGVALPGRDDWHGRGAKIRALHRTFFTPDLVQRLPAALQLLSGFQMLAGLVLLFFLGLGLRTRFRLR